MKYRVVNILGLKFVFRRQSYGLGSQGLNPDGARLPMPMQTSPGAHPDSYTMGTRSFPGVKHLGHGINHPPPHNAEVKEREELYLYSPV